jgi:hypothetical protein
MRIWDSTALTSCGTRREDLIFLPMAWQCAVCTIVRSIEGQSASVTI